MSKATRATTKAAARGRPARPTLPRPFGRTSLSASSFLGRARDLETLQGLVSGGARVITLLGAGGVGKTRLAERFVEAHGETLLGAGRTSFCDLTEARDVDGVCDAIARLVDSNAGANATTDERIEALGAALARSGPRLVVLDNCEQAIEAVALALTRWLTLAPSVTWLATSRERLAIAAEQVHELAPLEAPTGPQTPGTTERFGAIARSEAVRLFVDRARSARADYALSEQDAEAVAAIVQRLDGIPLAIELAAARVGVMSAAALLGRLETGLGSAATRGPRDAPLRHRTMRAAVAWSWELLEPWEAAALRQCSVFRGGFSLDAAERVVDLSAFPDAPAVVDVVQAVRDKSLVRAYAPGERQDDLRLALYESVRELAAEELHRDPRELHGARSRHARHTIDAAWSWLEGAESVADDPRARRALIVERDNLICAHAWSQAEGARDDAMRAALALEPTLRAFATTRAQVALLDETLRAPVHDRDGGDPRLRARLLLAQARCAQFALRYEDAERDFRQSLTLARATGDAVVEGRSLLGLFSNADIQGRAEEARQHVEAAVEALKDTRSRMRAVALGGLAIARRLQGRLDESLALFERAVRESAAGEHLIHTEFGLLLLEMGRDDDAVSRLEQALKAARARGQRDSIGIVLGYLAAAQHARGELTRALDSYKQATDFLRETASYFSTLVQGGTGAVLAALDRVEEARQTLADADALARVPPERDTLAVHRGHLDLALSRAKPGTEPQRHLESARARLSVGDALKEPNGDVKLALLILRRALDRSAAAPRVLQIGPSVSWFRVGQAERVALGRQHRLRRIVRALLDARAASPGRAVSPGELVAAVWPGERMLPQAAKRRVHVAISTLRNTGLRDVLKSDADGYLFDPLVQIVPSE